ncbi:hypothetical protein BDE40_2161 [Litoreibacter halocynthiae]|uniref:Uncharacterized protein n=1 Tax=Litoreibacter halocynthiae TaxID=1242689 RepID=A0A4R7LLW3_9RHOB|nr:hypothetical protein [Litoreibacter halocynthiae]TDT75431.1 hypothetical protein BDE40_2161 [Litoreibacter halocynthiae]
MRALKWMFVALAAYLTFSVVHVSVAYVWHDNPAVQKVINFGQKPDLFVWSSSGEEFLQDVTLNGEPLVTGEFFSEDFDRSPSEGAYYLFLLSDEQEGPPQSLRDHFGMSDKNIERVMEGGTVKLFSYSSGFQLGLFPFYIHFRQAFLVNSDQISKEYQPSCIRDIVHVIVTSISELEAMSERCRLQN